MWLLCFFFYVTPLNVNFRSHYLSKIFVPTLIRFVNKHVWFTDHLDDSFSHLSPHATRIIRYITKWRLSYNCYAYATLVEKIISSGGLLVAIDDNFVWWHTHTQGAYLQSRHNRQVISSWRWYIRLRWHLSVGWCSLVCQQCNYDYVPQACYHSCDQVTRTN